ncbi:hypothetical protein P3H15_51835, partial [Rhodococcus sp. T2V]|nr:hypothetical protein [Rhodococcus sp. T2V]
LTHDPMVPILGISHRSLHDQAVVQGEGDHTGGADGDVSVTTDIALRAEILADALIWLDFVLDVDLPDPPDMAAA